MSKQKWVAAYMLIIGLIGAYALVQEVVVRRSDGTYDWFDLWSHFTYQSNLFAVVVLLLTGTFTLWKGGTGKTLNYLRGAATLYMILTGFVYSLLVNNADPAVMIDHYIMHCFMPVAMVILWMMHPPEHAYDDGSEQLWLIYPMLYLVYVQAEGRITGDYFYAFLDTQTRGNWPVVLTVLALVVACSVIAHVMTRNSRKVPAQTV